MEYTWISRRGAEAKADQATQTKPETEREIVANSHSAPSFEIPCCCPGCFSFDF